MNFRSSISIPIRVVITCLSTTTQTKITTTLTTSTITVLPQEDNTPHVMATTFLTMILITPRHPILDTLVHTTTTRNHLRADILFRTKRIRT